MTADDDNPSESDNSDSRDTAASQTDRDDTLPVITELRAQGGWSLKLDLAYELGLTAGETDEYLQFLEKTGEVETIDLGGETLVTLSVVDTREAVAELSDLKEQTWRRERGESLPPLDDRH